MLIDHIGLILYPSVAILRIIGRLAFPIFAFLIAEGCRYTRNRPKYLLFMAILGIIMMLVQFWATGVMFGNIFITFSLSILMIFAIDRLKREIFSENSTSRARILSTALVLGAMLFCTLTCSILQVDYSIYGVMLPVLVSLVNFKGIKNTRLNVLDNHYVRLVLLTIGLVLLSIFYGGNQYFCLLAVPLLLFYNGARGRLNLKYFFYIFYPAHIVLLYGISLL